MHKILFVFMLLMVIMCPTSFLIAETVSSDASHQVDGGLGGEGASIDPQKTYRDRLNYLLMLTKKSDVTQQEKDSAVGQLLQFTKDNPDSVFVKDIKLGVQSFLFYMAVGSGDRERALDAINEAEKITGQYPKASFEEVTREIILAVDPDDVPLVNMPFQYAPAYWRGYMGEKFQDYNSSIDNFTLIKGQFVPVTPGEVAFLQDVYSRLISAYFAADQLSKGDAIMVEAIQKFPDTSFAQRLQQELMEKQKALEGVFPGVKKRQK